MISPRELLDCLGAMTTAERDEFASFVSGSREFRWLDMHRPIGPLPADELPPRRKAERDKETTQRLREAIERARAGDLLDR